MNAELDIHEVTYMTNQLFEKILIATDGSERNKAAVEEALQIGRVCGSTVFAAYVMDVSVFESASADVGDTRYLDRNPAGGGCRT